jgi:arabinose-5-phosphate isomerase
MNVIEEGIKVFDKEILALRQTSSCLGENFETIARTVADCRGKTLLIGVGKSGHIAKKISSTFSSLGIPSFFIHPSEALHGDLGAITSNDLVIIIRNS